VQLSRFLVHTKPARAIEGIQVLKDSCSKLVAKDFDNIRDQARRHRNVVMDPRYVFNYRYLDGSEVVVKKVRVFPSKR